MLNTVEPRAGQRAMRNAPKQDLRAWLAQMQEAGELVTVTGAERDVHGATRQLGPGA